MVHSSPNYNSPETLKTYLNTYRESMGTWPIRETCSRTEADRRAAIHRAAGRTVLQAIDHKNRPCGYSTFFMPPGEIPEGWSCREEQPIDIEVVENSADWRRVDPRVELVGRKHAALIVLRPHPDGKTRWEAGTAHAEMKHGWHVQTSFEDRRMISDDWPEGWFWTLAPDTPV